jgi:hypothetical protein
MRLQGVLSYWRPYSSGLPYSAGGATDFQDLESNAATWCTVHNRANLLRCIRLKQCNGNRNISPLNMNLGNRWRWFMLITNLTHFFNVSISLLYMFRATQCSSSGESIVSIHLLVYITLCRWSSVMEVRDLHTRRPPTQSDIYQMMNWYNLLLMMSTVLLETCREVK